MPPHCAHWATVAVVGPLWVVVDGHCHPLGHSPLNFVENLIE